jgi:hypothetical protein
MMDGSLGCRAPGAGSRVRAFKNVPVRRERTAQEPARRRTVAVCARSRLARTVPKDIYYRHGIETFDVLRAPPQLARLVDICHTVIRHIEM